MNNIHRLIIHTLGNANIQQDPRIKSKFKEAYKASAVNYSHVTICHNDIDNYGSLIDIDK